MVVSPSTDIVSFSPLVRGVGDGDIVAQDGYPLQSEGRTPGDEDSSGVDGDHSEVSDQPCACNIE